MKSYEYRFDRIDVKAVKTADGFIIDRPNLTRTGVFPYRNPDGSIRREYRPDEAVFDADSLKAFKGIPITDGHPGLVTSENIGSRVVGSVLSEGVRADEHVQADIIIYDPTPVDEGRKELSVGYKVLLDYTPGITPTGEAYDAIQKLVIPNHLALVPRGRALTARLNLDAADEAAHYDGEDPMDPLKMQQVRLDNGLAYDAAPEVALELERLRAALKEAEALKDQLQARADAFEAEAATQKEAEEAIRAEAFAHAKARLRLEAVAKDFEINFDGLSDTEIRAQVVKALRGDKISLEDRSDAYIEAAFDLALEDREARKETVAAAREQLVETRQDASDSISAAQARVLYAQNR